MGGDSFAKNGPVGGHEVHHAVGEPGVPEDLVDEVVGHDGRVTGFPYNAITLKK